MTKHPHGHHHLENEDNFNRMVANLDSEERENNYLLRQF